MPNREPKFHIKEILAGVGRSIKELLIILVIGEIFRIGVFIKIFGAEFLYF